MKPTLSEKRKEFEQDLCSYLLVVSPSPDRCPAACEFSGNALLPVGYVPFAEIRMKPAFEATVVRWIRNICRLHAPFTLEMNNYTVRPPSNICIQLLETGSLSRLSSHLGVLDSFLAASGCPPVVILKRPVMVIAEHTMTSSFFETALDFSQRDCTGSIPVDHVRLVRLGIAGAMEVADSFVLSAAVVNDHAA
ncbi:MAG TPA: hypothetical protein VFZ78_01035 [Flavisolibacter sp.]